MINTDKQKVWRTMLGEKTYPLWTKVFMEGSYFQGSWEKGNEILFLAPDENHKLLGMKSTIKENIEFQFVSITHLGMITDGEVDSTSDEFKKWTNCYENYTFTEIGNQTKVIVDMHVPEEYASMMVETWNPALELLKSLCES